MSEAHESYPRFASALQEFCYEGNVDALEDPDGTHSFKLFCDEIRSYIARDEDRALLDDKVAVIRNAAKQLAAPSEFADQHDSRNVEEACEYALKIFAKSHGKLEEPENRQLFAIFGPFTPAVAREASNAVYFIRELVDKENFKNAFRQHIGQWKARGGDQKRRKRHRRRGVVKNEREYELSDSSDDNFEPDKPYFGEGIKVAMPLVQEGYELIRRDTLPQALQSLLLDGLVASSSTYDFESFKLTGEVASEQTPEISPDLVGVLQALSKCSVEVEEVFQLLAFTTSDQLQDELCNLLGYDHLDLITILIQNQGDLVREYEEHKSSDQFYTVHTDRDVILPNRRGRVPGQSITVTTDKEKRLEKLIRKENKKHAKIAQHMGHANTTCDDVDVSRQRQLRLQAAQVDPILQPRRQAPLIRYKHVYDRFAEIKHNSAFVAGSKMVLPEGFRRKDTSAYEEITILPESAPPTSVGGERISIKESQDWVLQAGFGRIKQLNQIQTVVYDTAYRTNENLLICAPTGAGKTNIAALCILREVRANLDHNGVLQKDAFKIVYVAPMKALAAEMVRNFTERFTKSLGVVVRELTGDMQLTKAEIQRTQILVTTPEKWDVVTRKSTGDTTLVQLVRLIIIDEVHLLHDDRGAVIETLVARTLRQVELQQRMIRIVGLSATLPNYVDVASFLRVNPQEGLFFFDGRFRPVPLGQQFIGVKALGYQQQMTAMDNVCYEKVLEYVKEGHQVMVFVHARNATSRVANAMKELATNNGDLEYFQPEERTASYMAASKAMSRARHPMLQALHQHGFAIHHAGMVRSDRNIVERCFGEGHLRVLCCTSTLAWGVNLPAHAVVIRGTEVYDSEKGEVVDLGVLDVQQIFGRAGRPQFDTQGHGIIITSHDKLSHYLSLLTRQAPIESRLMNRLPDILNAEIVLGTVTNMQEAVEWMTYTYMYVRMAKNPLVYGITQKHLSDDPLLINHRRDLIRVAALKLDQFKMIRVHESEDNSYSAFHATAMGRTASHYYITCDTIELFNNQMAAIMADDKILSLLSSATEFGQLKVRDDELDELDEMKHECCLLPVAYGAVEQVPGKVSVLLQAHIDGYMPKSFSLISDYNYVKQNAGRILRALFEIVLNYGWASNTHRVLQLCKSVESQMWPTDHPLVQMAPVIIGYEQIEKLRRTPTGRGVPTVAEMRECNANEITHQLRVNGKLFQAAAFHLPLVRIEATCRPITRTVLQVNVDLYGDFNWHDRLHGRSGLSFWVWLADVETDAIYHSESVMLSKKTVQAQEPHKLSFTVPIREPLPTQYIIHVESDRWLGTTVEETLNFKHLILPEQHLKHTELLDLQPLPIAALHNPAFSSIYCHTHFNAVQTQMFFTLYHTDENVLVGAPTGSGKTMCAEIAMFRIFGAGQGKKVVYIAPLKALVRERVKDWTEKLHKKIGIKVVELTGDVTPDMATIAAGDVIVTTPEKWDSISRSWRSRGYVRDVGLIVIDEIHLLGEDRGPVLEVIVSRANYIAGSTGQQIRVVGLSTAIANASDLASWLNIRDGMFNFKPAVRPVPLEVHIQGFTGKFYCPRMATMNKPAFNAIKQYSPNKPVLIFVSSRRQTRLTALDLVTYLATEANPKMWLSMPESDMDDLVQARVKDPNLRLTLAFGIGLHHAGLQEGDRSLCEELFAQQKIQVLIATATLAWGINLPAHLVVVKGTEYFDGKTSRYVDFPITDVLQMIGRAGRPQFDESAVACVYVHDPKKSFYKKFLYEPFPVESHLLDVFPDHLNAEIVAGTVTQKGDVVQYLTYTYYYRRLLQNPSFYGLHDTSPAEINRHLSAIIDVAVLELQNSACVICCQDDNHTLQATNLGRIASFYYLSHSTVKMFRERLSAANGFEDVLKLLCDVPEYDEIPVRHNEDLINADLAKECRLTVDSYTYDDSHTKAHLLYQSHFGRLHLPSTDYRTDLKTVLDQSIRILQAMLDVSAEQGFLLCSLQIVHLLQSVVQGLWCDASPLAQLPGITPHWGARLQRQKQFQLPKLCDDVSHKNVQALFEMESFCSVENIDTGELQRVLLELPRLSIDLCLRHEEGNTSRVQGHGLHRVVVDREYLLNVDLRRLNRPAVGNSTRAYAPRFGKPKDEGWILIVGDRESRELIALKRVSNVRAGRTTKSSVSFYVPPEYVGRSVYYDLYVLSDSYLGLDQQFPIHLRCEENDGLPGNDGPPPGFE